jgi:hypothetical protein
MEQIMLNKIAIALSDVIGQENAEILLNMCQRVKERAIDRKSQQSVEVIFNEHGHVRHINGSDNVNGIKPKTYQSE